jgi:hypothetical protein
MKDEGIDNIDGSDGSPPQTKKRKTTKQIVNQNQMAPDSNGKPKLQKGAYL